MSFRNQIGNGIAKRLCDFDKSVFGLDETYWERDQRIMRECEKKNREQEKRDEAYKRTFGVYPNQTWGGNRR
jgi:hypothetical protein